MQPLAFPVRATCETCTAAEIDGKLEAGRGPPVIGGSDVLATSQMGHDREGNARDTYRRPDSLPNREAARLARSTRSSGSVSHLSY